MKILVALSRFPWPLEKGDKLRAWYQLQGLAANNELHLICLNEKPVSANDLAQLDFCASVQVIVQSKLSSAFKMLRSFFNPLPFQVNYFRSQAMKNAIATTIQQHKIEVCYVQLVRLGENLPFDQERRWVLDYMDTFSIGMGLRVAESNFLMRPFVRSEANRLRKYETKIAAHFDEMVIISQRDAEGLAPVIREEIHIIPNGVGENFFEDLPQPAEKDFDLIFFGNMGYHPNVQSARWLVEEVLPILHRKGIRPKLCIAGARPAPLIKAFESSEITVTGFVDDIRSFVLRSKVSVAPLVGGQGLQNKLLESMAMRIPVITTPVANAGLGAREGEEMMVCDGAEAFAQGIETLLNDPEKSAQLAAKGRSFVEANFRWRQMNASLEIVLGPFPRKSSEISGKS
jgi:polysaccharide biosynthesis protein PslH